MKPDHQQQQASYALVPARLQGPGSLDRLLETYNLGNSSTLFGSPEELLAIRAGANAVESAVSRSAFGCAVDTDPSKPPNNMFDTECFELTDKEKGSLKRLWSTLVIRHPFLWLFRRLVARWHWDYSYMDQQPEYWVPKNYGHPAPKLNWLQIELKRFLVHMTPIYQPWVYLLVTCSIIGVCLLSRTEQHLQISFIAASGLAHELGLFLLAPSSDYRYSHYMIYTSVIGLLLLLRTYLIGLFVEPPGSTSPRRTKGYTESRLGGKRFGLV
jgi:hypothetical protein